LLQGRTRLFAPLSPFWAQGFELEDALELREQHLDLLSLTLRRDIGIGYGGITGQISRAFMDSPCQLSGRHVPGWSWQ
jgi:hypothetical protein